jgi:hypothetical protein
MITLPSHTSHALQPLDVFHFNPFKTTFRKERDGIMANNNYTKLNKIILLHGWTRPSASHSQNKTSNPVLKFIKSGF